MAKPILILRLNVSLREYKEPQDVIDSLNRSTGNEYHVILVFDEEKEPRFEVLNADGIEPIELEKLKEIVNGTTINAPGKNA